MDYRPKNPNAFPGIYEQPVGVGVAPKPAYVPYAPKPNGYCVLHLGGMNRTIIGGPFDSFHEPAIGVCLEAHSSKADSASVLIDVPDFKAPTERQLQDGLVQLIAEMHANPTLPIYVGCRGGIGRTGTFIAALARVSGVEDPVAWTRKYYLCNAVETADQRKLVETFDMEPVLKALYLAPERRTFKDKWRSILSILKE